MNSGAMLAVCLFLLMAISGLAGFEIGKSMRVKRDERGRFTK